MAAQGPNERILCEKCFAFADSGAESCPECGAPLGTQILADAEREVHPQLAQANLHRLRGEYKEASDICLAILRRYPNNASANTMLGDIAVARGELDQAVEWFELALDINPDSKEVKEKLAAAQAEISKKELEKTAKDLEIRPPSKTNWPVIVGISVVVLGLIVGFFAFNSSRSVQNNNTPLVVGGSTNEIGKIDADPLSKREPEKQEPTDPMRILAEQIASGAGITVDRIKSIGVNFDDQSVRVGISLIDPSPEWQTRANVVLRAFELQSQAPYVEIHASRDGAAEGVHRIERAKFDEVTSDSFKAAHPNDYLDAVVRLFFPESQAPVDPPVNPPTDEQNHDELPPNPDGAPTESSSGGEVGNG